MTRHIRLIVATLAVALGLAVAAGSPATSGATSAPSVRQVATAPNLITADRPYTAIIGLPGPTELATFAGAHPRAVVYKYICFRTDGTYGYAGGQSTNAISAGNACYKQLGKLLANRMGYQCPYGGYIHTNNLGRGTYWASRADANFWDSVMCPGFLSYVGEGMFYH